MDLVSIKNATKRRRKPRTLTVEEFQRLLREFDWANPKLRVARAIVRQRVGDVKTDYSGRLMSIDTEMLGVFKSWRQLTHFGGDSDWVFASPVNLGRLPFSYPWVWKMFQDAGARAGIGTLGTHSLRHSYRSWLDAVGTPIAVRRN